MSGKSLNKVAQVALATIILLGTAACTPESGNREVEGEREGVEEREVEGGQEGIGEREVEGEGAEEQEAEGERD